MLIDSHAHLNFKAFNGEREEIISDLLSKKIWVVNVGTNKHTSTKAIEIAQNYKKGIYATAGLHPYHVVNSKTREEFDYGIYKKLAQEKKVVAIGETGLDYTYTDDKKERKLQEDTFKKQIKLAGELNLPIVIHCREAYSRLLEVLQENSYQLKNHPKGVVHFYIGTWSQAKKLFKLGFFISFTGVITFAPEYEKIVKKAPLKKIMIETDSPYATPKPHRGKRNKPQYVKYVAEKIAQIKNKTYQQVASQTTKNAKKFFNLENI